MISRASRGRRRTASLLDVTAMNVAIVFLSRDEWRVRKRQRLQVADMGAHREGEDAQRFIDPSFLEGRVGERDVAPSNHRLLVLERQTDVNLLARPEADEFGIELVNAVRPAVVG